MKARFLTGWLLVVLFFLGIGTAASQEIVVERENDISGAHPLVDHFAQTAASGLGTFGSRWIHTDATGTTYGLRGEAASVDGTGVFGSHNATTGTRPGVWGRTLSTAANARGVLGEVWNTAPGANSAGVRGANNGTGGSGFGVWGSQAGSGWGGYFTTPNGIGAQGLHSGTGGTSPGVLGTTNSTAAFAQGVRGVVNSTAPGGSSAGVRGINNGTGAVGIGVWGSHAGSGWGGFFNAPNGTGAHGTSTNGIGVVGDSTNGTGVYGSHGAATGTNPGVVGVTLSTAPSAVGVHGVVNSAAPGDGSAGVRGINNGTGTSGIGVWGSQAGSGWGGYFYTPNGIGAYGDSQSGTGVYGSHTATSGTNPGVWGITFSNATAATGVRGVVNSTSSGGYSAGVHGHNFGTGNLSIGVWGQQNGSGYGVYGSVPSITSGYGGYFAGRVHATGGITSLTGSFMIDHPLNPENKYLSHSSIHSPDMMNIYNGNIQLDDKGEAVVILPDYFQALNQAFRYQLTTIGGFAPVYIAETVANNQFKIAGGQPGMEVSWQVTGIRQDAAANTYRTVVEGAKPEAELGSYFHPEAFGLSQEQGMYAPPMADAALEESMSIEEMLQIAQMPDPTLDEPFDTAEGIDEAQE